ncbi:MAG: hypothetical protein EXR72_26515 [Myxococcales bacterium]|nr:hypothetical protein [Myxococcales bacterium]
MRVHPSTYLLGAFSLLFALGWGCGGNGCGVQPLPKAPAPRGFPPDQQIEGGMQVRITRPGFDKLSSLIPELAKDSLLKPQCLPKQKLGVVIGDLTACDGACNGGTGCPITIKLRPDIAPPGGIAISMKDNSKNAIVHIDMAFDIFLPINFKFKPIIGGTIDVCTLNLNAPANRINADIRLDIDPVNGELIIKLDALKIVDLNLSTKGCGAVGDILSGVLNIVNVIAKNFIGDLLIQVLKPQLEKLIQGFLPSPPGLAGVMPMGQSLASLGAPPDAALEIFMVAGGYVGAFNGGLNLGIISGMNSDRDPLTRGAGETSTPSLCVPARPAPDLGAAPWKLPLNAARKNHLLSVAPEFAGMPDPMDMMGKTKDLAIGMSRTFLDLAGFHLYNSGTLCLAISGGVLAQLNAGAVSVIVPSLSNILENRKGPLALAVRPQQPLVFTLGEGSAKDSLIHIAITDMRVDFYAFIEERYVRLFTIALDMNIGLNLSLTMTKDGKPAIQPMLTGIDKSSVMARVTNTDLLTEDPAKLSKALLSLIDIAVGQLMGGIKPFELPALNGFALDGLSITRVQTKQDDFVAIFGNLVQQKMMMMAPIPEAIVPPARTPNSVNTTAEIVDIAVPPIDVIREALLAGETDPGNLPTVTLALGGNRKGLEWSYRVDRGGWHQWSSDPKPTITDAAFVLQARHVIEVRAREKDDWTTEDQTPVELAVTIDSTPPELTTRVAQGRISATGWDNVSDDDRLRYAWSTPTGWSDLSTRKEITYDEAWAATTQGKKPLAVKVIDEVGNLNLVNLDLAGMEAFHGRTTEVAKPGGCSCAVGGAPRKGDGWMVLFGLLPVAGLLRRRLLRRAPVPANGRTGTGRRTLGLLIVLAAGSSVNAGCSCDQSSMMKGCRVDDDCRGTKCEPGEIPACIEGMCGCQPDTQIGDIGRFSSMAMRGSLSYIAAYNTTYGDLMIGHVAAPGVVKNWEFVDGIPETTGSDNPLSQVRGGITDKGDDVGRYASIAITPTGDPVIAYYDATHLGLKWASFGAVRWQSHTIDKGSGTALAPGNDFGRYASVILDHKGVPGIAYYAEEAKGPSGKRESQLRFAQAKTANPTGPQDWIITKIESRPMPDVKMGDPPPILPEGIALFCAASRKGDGSPVVAYYDRERGNLRYVEYDGVAKKWGTPTILDGEDDMGKDTADVGLYPSVVVEGQNAHITYVDAKRDNLLYVNTKDKTPEVIDDGFRPKEETTLDGLDSPIYHLVGDSSSIQILGGTLMVAYQDSTVEQLRFAVKEPKKKSWMLETIAGHGSPFKGSYGFYAQNRISGGVAILSSYAIDQHHEIPLFYVETFAMSLGIIP